MRYDYQGYHGCKSHCDIEIKGHVVIATQVPDNKGTSITNLAEVLATQIAQRYRINPQQLIWIEHYQQYGTYDLVKFTWNGQQFTSPDWTKITKDIAQQIWNTGVLPQGL